MFEVDDCVQQQYCQNLCWLGKLLDHKTLYFDVDPFMLHVLASLTTGYHIVGFIRREADEMGYRWHVFWRSCVSVMN